MGKGEGQAELESGGEWWQAFVAACASRLAASCEGAAQFTITWGGPERVEASVFTTVTSSGKRAAPLRCESAVFLESTLTPAKYGDRLRARIIQVGSNEQFEFAEHE